MHALILISIAIALFRFTLPAHPLSVGGSYTALAHLFIGGLIGAAVTTKNWRYTALVVALSAVEIVAFLNTHH
jgi:hypothetical protein